jgi:hypothetical protein
MEQVRKDVYRLMRIEQALFAYLDTLAKAFLTCVPKPVDVACLYARMLGRFLYKRYRVNARLILQSEACGPNVKVSSSATIMTGAPPVDILAACASVSCPPIDAAHS